MAVLRGSQRIVAAAVAKAMLPDENEDQGPGLDLEWTCFEPGGTAIQRVCHRLRDGALTVRFKNRSGYPTYFWPGGVPRELYRQWKRVQSPGKFYHRRIKNQY